MLPTKAQTSGAQAKGPCQNPMVDATTSPLAAPGISNMELPKSMISAYTIVQLVAAAIPEFVLQNRRGRGLSNMVLTPSLAPEEISACALSMSGWAKATEETLETQSTGAPFSMAM